MARPCLSTQRQDSDSKSDRVRVDGRRPAGHGPATTVHDPGGQELLVWCLPGYVRAVSAGGHSVDNPPSRAWWVERIFLGLAVSCYTTRLLGPRVVNSRSLQTLHTLHLWARTFFSSLLQCFAAAPLPASYFSPCFLPCKHPCRAQFSFLY